MGIVDTSEVLLRINNYWWDKKGNAFFSAKMYRDGVGYPYIEDLDYKDNAYDITYEKEFFNPRFKYFSKKQIAVMNEVINKFLGEKQAAEDDED